MSNHELMSSIDDHTLAQIMSKRHKSAKSQFRNPPQPRFCIRETEIQEGRPVFINVLSYSRIANQLSEFDPVSRQQKRKDLNKMRTSQAINLHNWIISLTLHFPILVSTHIRFLMFVFSFSSTQKRFRFTVEC